MDVNYTELYLKLKERAIKKHEKLFKDCRSTVTESELSEFANGYVAGLLDGYVDCAKTTK